MPYVTTEPKENSPAAKAMSLLELNLLVREVIDKSLPETYWVRAETSDVRVNAASGHCYLELIDKDETSGQIVAKTRCTIWARTFRTVKPYFEKETGQLFKSGLKVLVRVSIEFHELYGYSLNIIDIDPSYTLGDLVKKRKEIIEKLQKEGIFGLNKELPFPLLPQRIAVISSPTAAGFEDFADQLMRNSGGFCFYIKLFPAVMQGEKTEESVIAALDRIYSSVSHFDVVVIIRGGGSTSELSSFDSYPLAANCAQFPLPVVTGLGHERDDTILDMVAHSRMKTPTAVAVFLIECMTRQADRIGEMEYAISAGVTSLITQEKKALQFLMTKFPVTVTGHIERNRARLHAMTAYLSALPQWIRHHYETVSAFLPRVSRAVSALMAKRRAVVDETPVRLRRAWENVSESHRKTIALNEQYIKMVAPDYILKRGYSLTMKEGKIVKHAADLKPADEITLRFSDGERQGKII